MMERRYILFFLCTLFLPIALFAQTLEQAKKMYENNQYEKAKPVFEKYIKSQPGNANYNLWYGVCCLKTDDAKKALKYLEFAVKKRVPTGQFYLAETYNTLYRFEDAIKTYEEYIEDLAKKKKTSEEAEKLLERAKINLRMLKGVEEVCVIDSFVVDKENFLTAYKLSEEAGKLVTYNTYFKTEGDHQGIVYETELGNKVFYGEKVKNGSLNVFSKNKLLSEWSNGYELPKNINSSGDTNYPYVLSDGITIYYASNGEGAMGGYDIFVSRYNTSTDSFLAPENVGMPFNSLYNDYMYVVDEYNNLGWFASDRYQLADKVCIYVFVPNESKQTYNYESMETERIIRLAKLHSLKQTWSDEKKVTDAKQRLVAIVNHVPQEQSVFDFEFVIDDETTYYHYNDFKTPQAKDLFRKYQQKEKDFYQQENKLNSQRQWYMRAETAEKSKLVAAILDLEKRVLEMENELDTLAINVRNIEKKTSK